MQQSTVGCVKSRGITVIRNNSLAIRNGGCELQKVQPPAYLSVYINSGSLSPICHEEGSVDLYSIVNEAAAGNLGHPPYTYQWTKLSGPHYLSNVNGSNALLDFGASIGTTTVQVQVTPSDAPPSGCLYCMPSTVSAQITIEVVPGPCRIGKDEGENNLITISPNPSAGEYQISSDNNLDILKVEVFNVDGKMIMNEINFPNHGSLDLKTHKSGAYIVKVRTIDGIFSKTIILNK